MKIVLASMTIKQDVVDALCKIGGAAITVVNDEASAIAALDGADAFIISDNGYTAGVAKALKASTSLKWMQILTAGYDNATRLGSPERATITSVGDAFSPSVAVHAVAMLLGLLRGLPRMADSKAKRSWDTSLAPTMAMPEGKTLLIVGYGSIGQDVARMVAPIGMKVIGVNRNGAPHKDAAEVHKIEALPGLLPRADVLLVAAPLTPATTGMIGAKELALMKPTALVLNVSRGKLIDTAALVEALKSGRIAGAGLDVTEPEPLPSDHPLWDLPNVIVSPHVGGAAGPYGMLRQIERASANLRRYMAGEPLQNVVRP